MFTITTNCGEGGNDERESDVGNDTLGLLEDSDCATVSATKGH